MMSVSSNAIASLIRTGILVSPSPGNSITMAPMRTNTNMKAAESAGSRETSMRMFAHTASTAYDSRRYPHHFGVQRIRHERQCEQQRHEDRKDLRHEHQRLLLDLGQRLEQRHNHPDHETDHHQRRR